VLGHKIYLQQDDLFFLLYQYPVPLILNGPQNTQKAQKEKTSLCNICGNIFCLYLHTVKRSPKNALNAQKRKSFPLRFLRHLREYFLLLLAAYWSGPQNTQKAQKEKTSLCGFRDICGNIFCNFVAAKKSIYGIQKF
jgi:hypothetical protein